MTKRSNSELLEIVTKLKDDYQPEAVESAKEEIQSRNLTNDLIELAKSELASKEVEEVDKGNAKLEVGPKILFIIFYWGVIPWLIAFTYKNNGYSRKYREAWKFMLIGLIVHISLLLTVFLIFFLSLKMQN